MKQLDNTWARCQPTKCRHNKNHCARFTSPIEKHTPVRDLSKVSDSRAAKCAGYEWNGVK